MRRQLNKVSSGVKGLDEITAGGLPWGRATMVCGGPGSGKTLLAVTFLVEGALRRDEPGVLLSFEERIEEIELNCASLGIDLDDLQKRQLLATDYLHIDRQEIRETGEYDLEGLFIRLAYAVETVRAKRVVLDSIDTLFAGIPNHAILRAELRRLLHWLKQHDLTAIITAERGDGGLTRHGIEEYVSDCVILLEQRVQEELATRRLRVIKYRGSSHGTNEYPFLIEQSGLSLIPVTSLGLGHTVSDERIPSGIASLDALLEGKGYYRGSSILISGGPGTGKTSIGAHFAHAATERGGRCLYLAFEESESQLVRNMSTIGVDLRPAIANRLLIVSAVRPTTYGLEMHLARMLHDVRELQPDVVVVDPLSALQASGSAGQSGIMVLRLIDYLKSAGATALYLTVQGDVDKTDLNISSLMDTWITLKNHRENRGLQRRLYVVKSRGMAHSSDVCAFSIGAGGVRIDERKEGS
jgi:circadian clock protein KaiC